MPLSTRNDTLNDRLFSHIANHVFNVQINFNKSDKCDRLVLVSFHFFIFHRATTQYWVSSGTKFIMWPTYVKLKIILKQLHFVYKKNKRKKNTKFEYAFPHNLRTFCTIYFIDFTTGISPADKHSVEQLLVFAIFNCSEKTNLVFYQVYDSFVKCLINIQVGQVYKNEFNITRKVEEKYEKNNINCFNQIFSSFHTFSYLITIFICFVVTKVIAITIFFYLKTFKIDFNLFCRYCEVFWFKKRFDMCQVMNS